MKPAGSIPLTELDALLQSKPERFYVVWKSSKKDVITTTIFPTPKTRYRDYSKKKLINMNWSNAGSSITRVDQHTRGEGYMILEQKHPLAVFANYWFALAYKLKLENEHN